MYFDDVVYAERRLKDTVIRDKTGEPVYVKQVFLKDSFGEVVSLSERPLNRGELVPILDGEEVACNIMEIKTGKFIMGVPLRLLDISPVPLGYINGQQYAAYCMRMPIRGVWKQGLYPKCIKFIGAAEDRSISSKHFRDSIVGEYPTIENIEKGFKSGVSKLKAFCRTFAINSDGDLHYKGNVVGTFKKGKFSLDKKSSYLEETLKEVVG